MLLRQVLLLLVWRAEVHKLANSRNRERNCKSHNPAAATHISNQRQRQQQGR